MKKINSLIPGMRRENKERKHGPHVGYLKPWFLWIKRLSQWWSSKHANITHFTLKLRKKRKKRHCPTYINLAPSFICMSCSTDMWTCDNFFATLSIFSPLSTENWEEHELPLRNFICFLLQLPFKKKEVTTQPLSRHPVHSWNSIPTSKIHCL